MGGISYKIIELLRLCITLDEVKIVTFYCYCFSPKSSLRFLLSNDYFDLALEKPVFKMIGYPVFS